MLRSMKNVIDLIRSLTSSGALEPYLSTELERAAKEFEHGYVIDDRHEMKRAADRIAKTCLKIELPR